MCDGCCTCSDQSRQLIAKAKKQGRAIVKQPGNSDYLSLIREHGTPPFALKEGHRIDL